MTANQQAEKDAYVNFFSVVNTHNDIARSVPMFFKYSETLRTLFTEALVEDEASKHKTNATTEDKLKTKGLLFTNMELLTRLTLPYALDTDDTILKDRVDKFKTVFGATAQGDIATLCKDILKKMHPHLAALVVYGITTEQVEEAQGLIDAYEGKVPETRAQTKERVGHTEKRDALFAKMFALVQDRILNSVEAFKKDNADFYTRITNALAIAQTQTKPTILRIKFKNTSGKRFAQALTARIVGNEAVHTANDKGEIVMKFDKGGYHDIEIPLEGGESIKLPRLRTVKGKTKTVTVEI
jgi:hypothetical protein